MSKIPISIQRIPANIQRIPVYKQEQQDGLANSIAENSVIKADCPVVLDSEKIFSGVIQKPSAIANIPEDQLDLFYLHTILVSTGWNKNDDIFDSVELWKARSSPQDKPFNLQHKPGIILGHITNHFVLDDNMKIIDDAAAVENLPDKYHIATSAVIYRQLDRRDPDLSDQIESIIAEIELGNKWFVSMECLFNDFDYGMIDSQGNSHIVSRNSSTAFLTKHIRSYGGSGVYNDCKIGRVLRNITFSGKGLVERPANSDSIIFDKDNTIFNGLANTLKSVLSLAKYTDIINSSKIIMGEKIIVSTGESNKMSDNHTEVQDLKAEVASLKDRLNKTDEDKIKSTIASLESERSKAIEDKDVSEAKFSEFTKTNDEKIVDLENKNSELDSKLTEATSVKETIETELVEAKSQLEDIAAESLKVSRISSLVDRGVKKDDAEAILEKFVGLSDEMFAEIVTLKVAGLIKHNDSEDTELGNVSDDTLSNSELEDDAELATSNEDEPDLVFASIANYMNTELDN